MKYTFNDIAGYEQEKNELKRLCNMFKNRAEFEEKGGKLPRGIVFYGNVGNGKTLFAKVLADECGLETIKIDLGKCETSFAINREIKQAFDMAKSLNEPCMIFFDELDKVIPNHEEEYYTDRSKTILTQLLTLIDGMESERNVIFVATCNSYHTLNPALVRPGRIDKKIEIPNPTYKSKIAILKMYANKTKCKFGLSMEEIARLCGNMCCAGLETLINECVLCSNKQNYVSEKIIREKFEEIKTSDIVRKEDALTSLIFACRNVGELIVAREFNDGNYVLSMESDSVCNDFFNKLISDYDDDYDSDDYDDDDGDDDYGYERNSNECKYFSEDDMKNAITVIFGGYVAEELILNKVFENVKYQLRIVDKIVDGLFEMGAFGIEYIYSDCRDLPYTGEKIAIMNEKAEDLIKWSYENAKSIVLQNQELIKVLIPKVIEMKTISKIDCEQIIEKFGS